MRKIIGVITLLLALVCPKDGISQSCGCTDCPGVVAPFTTMDFHFEVLGASNDDLSNATQGVCAVLLDIKPEHFWSTQFKLTSPSGQEVTLIGPPRLDLLIGYSAVGPWNISFLPCGDAVEPDPLFPAAWDNDSFDFGIVGGNYSGSYYPYSGCLQDFNTGTVNGIWTLSVQNVSGFYSADVDFFQVVFCDESGLDCDPCDAVAGVIGNNTIIDACASDTLLNLDLPPSYSNTVPDTNLYGYTYIVSYNGIIEEYNPNPNLIGWNTGTYLICGLSYSYADSLKVPQPNGSLTRVDLEAALQNLNPIFCGDITDDCVIVNILPPDTLNIDAFLCAGDSYEYQGISYDTAGIYTLDIASGNGCDSTIIINLTGIDSIRTTIDTAICNGELFGVGSQSYTETGSYVDTLSSFRNCDSIVYLNLQVRDSIITYIDKAICIGDSCVMGSNVYNSNGVFVNNFTAFNGCDSTVVLDLKILDPDILIAPADILNCLTSPITLNASASSSGPSIIYEWIHLDNGGDGIVSGGTTLTPQVNKIGTYQLNLTDTLRAAACMVSATVNVFGDLSVPHILANVDSITCNQATATLFGLSLTAGVSYEWNGPNGFYTTQKDTITDIPGFYTFIVTGTNGCQDSLTLEVKENTQSPIATIIGDSLNCNNSLVTLDGTSSTGLQLTYEWRTGTWSYINNTSSISVVIADTYALIVQNGSNGCKDTSYYEVIEDISVPDIIVEADTLTCSNPIASLTGNSTTIGVSYLWTGPSSFVAYAKDTLTNIPGIYTLSITGLNGCSIDETIEVVLDQDEPSVTTSSDLISCTNPIATLNANSSAALNYYWTGPLGFEAFSKDTFTNEPGLYQLTVTATNGCTRLVEELVLADVDIPNIAVDADTITCDQLIAGLYGSSTTANVEYNWIGSAGFESQMADTITDMPGAYQLTVTATNGCTASAQVLVNLDQNQPDISISADTITCAVLQASLNGASTTGNASYEWTGPLGFLATNADTITEVPGNYELTVTGENGCTNSLSVTVAIDQAIPTIDASVGSISCTASEANLNGSSTTENVSYSWTGPAAYQSTNPDTVTSIPGWYQFVVTAANGCTNEIMLEVIADQDIPDLSATADTLTCAMMIANLNGSSSVSGLSYEWTGPAGFMASSADTITNTPGLYQLTATAANGCSINTQVEVIADIVIPDISVYADTLNCSGELAALVGNSTSPNVNYLWTGPGGFITTKADTVTHTPGVYLLTITGNNACTVSEEILVVLDESVPDIAANVDSITCIDAAANLSGSSSTIGVNYVWTGPAGFYAEKADTSTTIPGLYQLEVTGPNACSATLDVVVVTDQNIPTVMAQADSISCGNTIANLQADAGDMVTYQWIGPSGFSATQADTVTTIAGDYQVIVTAANGCSATAELEVVLDTLVPIVAISADTLSCSNIEAQLLSESLEEGLTYQWTGPLGFVAEVADTLTNVAGLYQLIATGQNACSTTLEIEVQEDIDIPNILATADSINCSTSTANLIGNSTTAGVTYQWLGTAGFESQMADTVTSMPGAYQLTVTAPNGCTASQQVLVVEDLSIPDILAEADSITCVSGMAHLQASSATANVSYQWTGPNGFLAFIADTSTAVAGIYQLEITAVNTCSATAEVEVYIDQDVPVVLAQADTLNCSNTIANLQVDASGEGLSYQWTGPAGFSATQADTLTEVSGIYQIVVSAENGCTITTEVEVVLDTLAPSFTLAADTLSCNITEAALTSVSSVEGLSYEWTGPNGFMAQVADTTTTITGVYQLLVIGLNNCSSSQEIEVLEDIVVPNISASADSIDCNSSTANLTGFSITPGVTYQWLGTAGFESQMADTVTNMAGAYQLTITAPNGCSISEEVLVVSDQSIPDIVATSDSITCSNNEAMLLGSSTVEGGNYSWTGPNGFFSQSQDTITSIPGSYQLTITVPSGCSASTETTVIASQDLPNIEAMVDTISCTVSTANLIGNSSTANVSYEWTGPGGFIAYSKDTLTNVPGLYELKVTAPNTCTATMQVEVVADQNIPDITVAADTLNCLSTSSNLIGNSTMAMVSYQWTGPAGFSAQQKDTITEIPGIYQLTVTASNNCSAVAQVEVIADLSTPELTVIVDTIDCISSSANLTVNALDPNIDYEWTGPMGFTANVKDTSTTIAGLYNLSATGANGCTANISAEVIADANIPDLSATADTITCEQLTASLIGNSTTGGLSYEWTGSAGFIAQQKDTSTTIPGTYQLVATSSNGCSQSIELEVISDQMIPDISASADSISCTSTTANLFANSTTEDVSYLWIGPGGFNATTPDTFTNVAGIYVLTVIGSNACTASMELEVFADQDLPQVSATADTINCLVLEASLSGNSSNASSYEWIGPNGFTAQSKDTTTTIPGLYQLIVTADNSCSATTQVEVINDQSIADFSAIAEEINCLQSTAQLLGNSTDENLNYEWSGPAGFVALTKDTLTDLPGIYTLKVTNLLNGCSATEEVEVVENIEAPILIAADISNIDCNNAVANLTASSSTVNVSYQWIGPNGFLAMVADTLSDMPGMYQLVLTGDNACTTTTEIELIEDLTIPNISAMADTINCNNAIANLNGNSTTPNVSYEWSGPNGFTAISADTMSNVAGSYQLIVTGANSCTAILDLVVVESIDAPNISASADTINCNQLTANLMGNSTTDNVIYEWSGPNGFIANQKDTSSTIAGVYQLTITGINGCTAVEELLVVADQEIPDLVISADSITCSQSMANLSASSTSTNVEYQWTGPNNFVVNEWNAQTSVAGVYQFVVTASNACTAAEVLNVVADTIAPIALANLSGSLNCAQILAVLDGSTASSGSNLLYEWQDEQGLFLTEDSVVEVSENGTYQFIVTDLENACMDTAFLELNIDTMNLEQAPVAVNDFFEMNNLELLNLDLSQNDLFNQVSNWDLQILDAPNQGDLQLLSPGLFEFSSSDYSGTVSFEYELCNDLCPDLCDTATVEIQISYQILSDTLLDIPTGFTPNNDGKNDVFIIPELELNPDKYPKNELLIFNRWGDIIYQASPYNNDWNGTSKTGKELPHGTYYYILRLELSTGKIYQGDITILR